MFRRIGLPRKDREDRTAGRPAPGPTQWAERARSDGCPRQLRKDGPIFSPHSLCTGLGRDIIRPVAGVVRAVSE